MKDALFSGVAVISAVVFYYSWKLYTAFFCKWKTYRTNTFNICIGNFLISILLSYSQSANAFIPDIDEQCSKDAASYRESFNSEKYQEAQRAWLKYSNKKIRIEDQDSQKVKYYYDLYFLKLKIDFCNGVNSYLRTLNKKEEFITQNYYANESMKLFNEMFKEIESSANLFTVGGLFASDLLKNIDSTADDFQRKLNLLYSSLDKTYSDKSSNENSKSKHNNSQNLTRDDVVSQVLNYAIGVPENGSGEVYFYPWNTENGMCVYKIAFNEKNQFSQAIQGMIEAGAIAEAMGIPGVSDINSTIKYDIDLNKADLKNITFYKHQGAKQNQFTGITTYFRYKSRVEGLPDIFECDGNSCNVDRLKRGWNLVASKCKGTKKAF